MVQLEKTQWPVNLYYYQYQTDMEIQKMKENAAADNHA